MKTESHVLPGFRGAERAAGVRIGRFVLRGLGLLTPAAEFLPIFEHCSILRAEHSFVEGGTEYIALSPLFDPLEVSSDSCVSDRDVPRYVWESTTDPDTGRVYSARPIRVG